MSINTPFTKLTVIYNKMDWFTEPEAWTLFKLAAFGEAIGWTLLIIGVGLDHYGTWGHGSALILAGRLHGMFFIMYIIATLILSKSLGWKKHETVIAALMSVPPYGTLVVETFMSYRRQYRQQKIWHASLLSRIAKTN